MMNNSQVGPNGSGSPDEILSPKETSAEDATVRDQLLAERLQLRNRIPFTLSDPRQFTRVGERIMQIDQKLGENAGG